MQRIPSNSRVRRRLFPAEDVTDEARVDNFANFLQESIIRDRIEMSQKYSFDFKNEVPLDGNYVWFRNNKNGDWVGIELGTECKGKDEFANIKKENEATPSIKDRETVPLLRKKRKNSSEIIDTGVRRKISFD